MYEVDLKDFILADTNDNVTWYRQEDILQELAPKQNFTYSVTRPSHILGAAKGNYMNLA
jgi:hypothetical protein